MITSTGTVMSLPTLFGIPNCDTIRKARKWLDTQGIAHNFVDLRDNTPSVSRVESWLESVGAERLINRRSRTYKQLDEAQRYALNGNTAAELLLEHPTLIKRPVLVWQGTVSVGFSEQDFAARFNV